MKSIILWNIDENFDKKDFKYFVRELPSQAKKWHNEKTASCGTKWDENEADDDTLSKMEKKFIPKKLQSSEYRSCQN